ncbi:hypothetical protein D2962_09760 [Biomaibacter acetigenes]|jgi:hypothetical protein|uniref:Uncharacterized protein n=1 Tax=Biomaibacter acetigenes TaxID=2316383 RepID=A0A3G2R675_9FIRM|nr:hypothetical protein D2962_09760 [Biomaibacter acetigenes]
MSLTYDMHDGKIYPIFKCDFCGWPIFGGSTVVFRNGNIEILHNSCWLSYLDQNPDALDCITTSLGILLDSLRENTVRGKYVFVNKA